MQLKCLKTVYYYFKVLPHELVEIATYKKITQSNGLHSKLDKQFRH